MMNPRTIFRPLILGLAVLLLPGLAQAQHRHHSHLAELADELKHRAELVHEQAHHDVRRGRGSSHLDEVSHQLAEAVAFLSHAIHHGHGFTRAFRIYQNAHAHLMRDRHRVCRSGAFDNDLRRYLDARERFLCALEAARHGHHGHGGYGYDDHHDGHWHHHRDRDRGPAFGRRPGRLRGIAPPPRFLIVR